MNVDRYDGPAARAAMRGQLQVRHEAGRSIDDNPRVLELLALENTGTRRARTATVVQRARLAQVVARSKVRTALFRGEITPAEAREAGLPVPNRATRRRLARGGR